MSRTPGQKPPIASNDSQSRSTNDSERQRQPTQEKINPFEDENNEDDLFGIEFDRIRHTTATTSSSTNAAQLNMSTSSSSSNSNNMKANPSNTSEQLLLSFDDPYRSGCGVTIPSSLHLLQPSSSPLLPSSPASSPSPSSQLLINLSGPITSLPPPHPPPLHIGSSISNSTSPNSSSPNQSNNTLSSANSRQIYHQSNIAQSNNFYNPYNPTPTNHYRTHVKSNSCSNIGGNYNLMMMMNKPPTIGEVSPNIDAGIVSYLNSKARTGNNTTSLNAEPNSTRTNRQSSGSSSSSIYVTHF